MIQKVIRDGKVAVLYSPGYGAGWYTWSNEENLQVLFHPKLVALVENGKNTAKAMKQATQDLGIKGFFTGGAPQLKIEWIPEGEQFYIDEYDGYESVICKSDSDIWITA